MYSNCLRVTLSIAVLLITACSEAPKPAPANPESAASPPSEPVSGKTAFWAMYKQAFAWANDMVPLKLESKSIAGVKNTDGKAGMWTGTFGSYKRHEALMISYAVVAQPPDILKGLNSLHPVTWNGPSRDVAPFQSSDFMVDSDAAYKTALAEAQPWLSKHPDKEVSLLLGNNPTRFSKPVWVVLWGDSKSGYEAFIDATSGAVAKPGR